MNQCNFWKYFRRIYLKMITDVASSSRYKYCSPSCLIVYLSIAAVTYMLLSILVLREMKHVQGWKLSLSKRSHHDGLPEVLFALVLCDGSMDKGKSLISDGGRQLRQAKVLIKSAVVLTKVRLRFLLVVDSQDHCENLVKYTQEWPVKYRMKITFECRKIWYPKGRETMLNLFRACACARLFLSEMFTHTDALIFVDTDMIFMSPPEELWQNFYMFDEHQLAALSPSMFCYHKETSKVPFYGDSGLNAGLMLMNLTRMSARFPQGWMQYNMDIYDEYGKNITHADQDILNIIFNKNSDLLYQLGCEWNFRTTMCLRNTGSKCPAANSNGARLLHGTGATFLKDKERKFQIVFHAWENHEVGADIRQLAESLATGLAKARVQRFSRCGLAKNIDYILFSRSLHWDRPHLN